MAVKEQYISYIKKAVMYGREKYDANIKNWENNFDPNNVFGYSSPAHIPLQAHIEGFMYWLCGDDEYAVEAKKCLLDVEKFKKYYPDEMIKKHPEYENGLPAVDPAFSLQPYINGYLYIKDSGVINDCERFQIENSIKSSVDVIFHFPEWGAHNRSMLRVWSLSAAAKALGKNSQTDEWQKLANYLAEETVGKWSIEDAELYMALWLIASINYIEITNRQHEYYRMPQTKYYFDYVTHLITSYGQIPDFGDSHFNSNWYMWLACLEKGAAIYNCGYMKYAAQKIWDFGLSINNCGEYSPGIATYLIYAYLYSDDLLVPIKPDWESGEVMEELVGKKIAFRNGWDDSSTYMLLNYRDEGYYSYTARNYLRTTLSVRAEKMHHGHSDENSIVFFVKDSNILLNDGGYREKLPNGKYRADIYHNRLVFREGLKSVNAKLFDFLQDGGYYKKTITEKLHFQEFKNLVFSRTRLYNNTPNLIWDRIITYLKNDDIFILIDWVSDISKSNLTIANSWHTGEVLLQKGCAFDTRIPFIYRYPGDAKPLENKGDLSLCIEFANDQNESKKTIEVNEIMRHYTKGVMISQFTSKGYGDKEAEYFVTVLTPHNYFKVSEEIDKIIGRVSIESISKEKDIILLNYKNNDNGLLQLTYKLNLKKGIDDDEDAYPRYSWESGKILYNEILTDADFAFVEEKSNKISYGFINGSGIEYRGKKLYRTPDFTTHKFGTDIIIPTNHKWKAWDGELSK